MSYVDLAPIKLINRRFSLIGMKKALFSLILVFFLVACVGFKQGSYSFEDGFNYIKALDDKYGGNFRTERIVPWRAVSGISFIARPPNVTMPMRWPSIRRL